MNKNNIPAVEKTLQILEKLHDAPAGRSQAEICRETGVSTSTCYRILQTLMTHGWVRRDRRGEYVLAREIRFGETPEEQLLAAAQPELEKLAETIRLTCKLSIRKNTEQISVLRAESPDPFAVTGKLGGHFPVIEGTVGATLLSGTEESGIRSLARACREPIPEAEDPEIIFERIRRLQKDGYVINRRPNRWHVQAMSVPLSLPSGQVIAALTVLGLPEDFPPEKRKEIFKAMKQTIHTIQQKTGER